MTWVALALAGGLGAVLRVLVDGGVMRRLTERLLLGTLAVNLTGSFALGLLDGIVLPDDLELVVSTGLIGAYTTFSTWMLETQQLASDGRRLQAATYVVVSLAAGLALAWLGLRLGHAWAR